MDNDKLKTLLEKLDACVGARQWVGDRSLSAAWKDCQRADWMLWLVGRMAGKDGWPTLQQVVSAACDCAETALKFVSEGEERPRLAIEVARRWATGKAKIAEVRKAAYAAYAAASYDAAASKHAAHGAYLAASAAYGYPADVAAVHAAAASGDDDKALAEMADIVRKAIPVAYEERTA